VKSDKFKGNRHFVLIFPDSEFVFVADFFLLFFSLGERFFVFLLDNPVGVMSPSARTSEQFHSGAVQWIYSLQFDSPFPYSDNSKC